MYYKPESLEENFSNVLKLRDNFMNNIKSINNAIIINYNKNIITKRVK